MKKDEINAAYGTYKEDENYMQCFNGNPSGKKERVCVCLTDRTDEIRCEVEVWIPLVHRMLQVWAFVTQL
jgi:hypothetical protein